MAARSAAAALYNRDFGSLVSLGKWSAVGNLVASCLATACVEGLFAWITHEHALNGTACRAGLLARALARCRAPHVKLHSSSFDPVGERIETVERMDDTLTTKLLPFVLSMIAGSADAIGFLGLAGLFIAHITGNLVILAAKLVVGGQAPASHLLSVPVFMVALAGTRLLASWLVRLRVATLRPLLLLQFLLLCAFLAFCIAAGPHYDSNSATMIIAAMLGVSAMAVQNALVQIALTTAPSTAVMTTNMTRLAMDVGEALLGSNCSDRARTTERAWRNGLVIAGFVIGCGLGAWCQARAGLWSLTLPTGLSLVVLVMAPAKRCSLGRKHRPGAARYALYCDGLPPPTFWRSPGAP